MVALYRDQNQCTIEITLIITYRPKAKNIKNPFYSFKL